MVFTALNYVFYAVLLFCETKIHIICHTPFGATHINACLHNTKNVKSVKDCVLTR